MKKISKMRWLRLLSRLTIDELSISAGLDRGLLSRAERGLYKLTPEQKKKIARALETSEDDLFAEEAE
jgi:transcriptional regulator with XRE-family HTH domain